MLRIVNWSKYFENNRSREIKRLDWVPFPNKHDGDGYSELLDHPDGAAHYGAWCALVQVASKCDPRGTLLRDGARPHTAATLARMTRIPEPIMAAAIKRLVEDIAWVEIVSKDDESQALATIPHDDAVLGPHPSAEKRLWNGMEWNGMEWKYSLSLADGIF